MKRWKFYLLKYQLSDLKTYFAFKEDDILKLRRKFEILFIDDDEIAYLENLKSNGFNVTYKTNITNINDVSASIVFFIVYGFYLSFGECFQPSFIPTLSEIRWERHKLHLLFCRPSMFL